MMFYGNQMSGWGFAVMTISGIVLLALAIAVVLLLFRCAERTRPASEQHSPSTPEQLLAERFARGDIGESEYVDRLATLHGCTSR